MVISIYESFVTLVLIVSYCLFQGPPKISAEGKKMARPQRGVSNQVWLTRPCILTHLIAKWHRVENTLHRKLQNRGFNRNIITLANRLSYSPSTMCIIFICFKNSTCRSRKFYSVKTCIWSLILIRETCCYHTYFYHLSCQERWYQVMTKLHNCIQTNNW